jgi:hypothetical protein
MDFKRVYDVSFLADDLSREALINAIEAVNMACTSTLNAWLYVESGEIARDYNRVIDPNDSMKSTIFNHMAQVRHSGTSISYAVQSLICLVTDYESWKRKQQEKNSLIEGEIMMVDQFRQNTLVPYYRSMSGGGSIRVGAGPVVNEFLEIYDRLTYTYTAEIRRIYDEVLNLLGTTSDERIAVLDDILANVYNSTRLSTYRDALKMRKAHEKRMDDLHSKMIDEQIPILRAAIESRNLVALKAALHPVWGSMRLMELKEYRDAQVLLDELSSSGVHVDENSS